jgi:hypothetical protein
VVIENGLFARPQALIGANRPRSPTVQLLRSVQSPAMTTGPDGTGFINMNSNTLQTLGDFLFVQTLDGNVLVTPFQSIGGIHHSSLGAGQPVLCKQQKTRILCCKIVSFALGAGTMRFVDGKLVHVSNQSGHYMPRFVKQKE